MDRVNSFTNDNIREGRIWVISESNGAGEGTFQHPFASVERAIERANPNGGDILFLTSEKTIKNIPTDKPVTIIQAKNQNIIPIAARELSEKNQILAIK